MNKIAVIIGAGPAGLTAAYELITKTDIKPIIIEQSNDIGGICKTVVHNGNRIDIGGHRFFSKSDVIMKWWQQILPLQGANSKDDLIRDIQYQNKSTSIKLLPGGPDPEKEDKVMLVRKRLSRIYYLRKFFDYPIKLNLKTLSNIGFIRVIKIGVTYAWIRIFPIKDVISLEDFLINRFGRQLYKTFFKDYTEKVWGKPCAEISAEWGAQRIKELSITKAVLHALRSAFKKDHTVGQKHTDTSLIEQFMYPKLGPGQMWETVAHLVIEKGGIIIKSAEVVKLDVNDSAVISLTYFDKINKSDLSVQGDYFISTMPIQDLVTAMGSTVPASVKILSDGLQYRDFITVGLLLNKLKIKNNTKTASLNELIPDNWLYIQEKQVKVGRLQIFNNWSPYMVADISKVWIGLEYFCNQGDELWQMTDTDFIKFAIKELDDIDIIDADDVIDSTIIRMPKTYPGYFGAAYKQFDTIREFTDKFENLYLIGRNGMHKYNNQDHSMLTAMAAVENITAGKKSKANIWDINTEEEYAEKHS